MNLNKIPPKEQKRIKDYQFNQTERDDNLHIKRETQKLTKMKRKALEEGAE